VERTEIRLTGFGGQGIILAGYIVGKAAALYDKRYATFTQSYGPESRGGACAAQVILSNEPVQYPHLIDPSIVVVMSQEAYYKYEPTLHAGVKLLVDQDLVVLDRLPDGVDVYSIPATQLAETQIGRRLVANIVMLGFFTAVSGVVSEESMRRAVTESVPKGTEELNLRAFKAGLDHGREALESSR
jgi:2-oxoglutarate ferredoxin oxidoreductase subunit gamma